MTTAPVCFDCRGELGGFTPTVPGDVPSAGAVSVCLYCGAAAIFTGKGLEIREPTEAERADIDANPDIIEVRRRVNVAREAIATGVAVLDQTRLPCGCVLTQALVNGDRQLLIEACSQTCKYLAYAVTESRKQGKPTEIVEGASLDGYLAEHRRSAS